VVTPEHRGPVEIRWDDDGDPDDVVAPYPDRDQRVAVHVERMDTGDIWMAIQYDETERVVMWFRAVKKNVLEWTVWEPGS
jgi:hypothetical protein